MQGNHLDDPLLSLRPMVDGTAPRPYVYRALLPLLLRPIDHFMPSGLPWMAGGAIYSALLGFIFSLRYLLRAFRPASPGADLCALFASLALLPLMFGARNLYDLPTLFLFTLGLALLAHRRWNLFLPLYLLACLNKETTILLTLVYTLYYYDRLEKLTFYRVLGLQLAGYLIIRLLLLTAFAGNPGGLVQFHLFRHLPVMLDHPFLAAGHLVFGVLVSGLSLYRWSQKPVFLRVAAGATILPLLLLYFFFGFPFEIRVFYEAHAPLFLLSIWSLSERLIQLS